MGVSSSSFSTSCFAVYGVLLLPLFAVVAVAGLPVVLQHLSCDQLCCFLAGVLVKVLLGYWPVGKFWETLVSLSTNIAKPGFTALYGVKLVR